MMHGLAIPATSAGQTTSADISVRQALPYYPRCKRRLTMAITITAFESSPDGGKGLARDTRSLGA